MVFLDGLSINADFYFHQMPSGLIKMYYPIWNDILDSSTIERLPQLPLILIAYFYGSFLHLTTQQTLGWLSIFFSTFAGFGIYSLCIFCWRQNNPRIVSENIWGAFFAGFVYMWSPFVVGQATHLFIRVSHGILPFMALTFFKAFETQQKRFIALSAVLWALITCSAHWIIYGPVFFLSFTFFWTFREIRKNGMQMKIILQKIKISLSYLILLLIFFIGYTSFWFLPGALMGGVSLYSQPIEEIFELLYRNAIPSRIVRFMGNWLIDGKYMTSNLILNSNVVFLLFLFASIIAFALAIMALSFHPKDSYVIFFSLFTIVVFFILITPFINEDLFSFFLADIPFNEYYAWAFRSPKYQVLLLLAVAVLVGYSTPNIVIQIKIYTKNLLRSRQQSQWIKGLKLSFFGILIFLQILAAWPLATGDFNGTLEPVKLPTEIERLEKWLKDQNEHFNVLWVPGYLGNLVDWNLNRSISSFITVNFPKPVISPNKPAKYLAEFFLSTDLNFGNLLMNKTKQLGKYLTLLGIKYVILHNDIPEKKSQLAYLKNNLLSQQDLQLVEKDFGFLNVFENTNFKRIVGCTESVLWVINGFQALEALDNIDSYNPFNYPLIFAKQNKEIYSDLNGLQLRILADYSTSLEDIIFLNPNDVELLSLGDYGNEEWESIDLENIDIIDEWDLSIWDIPFGVSGVVSEDDNSVLTLNFRCTQKKQWEFFLRKLDSQAGGLINVSITNGSNDEIMSFQFNTITEKKASFNWVHKSINLTEGLYKIQFCNEFGLNVLDSLVLVPSDQYSDLLSKANVLLNKYPIIIYCPIPNSNINQTFELKILHKGIFRISHNSARNPQIYINKKKILLSNESQTPWKTSNNLQLNQSTINITVTTNQSTDSTTQSFLWLYSVSNDSETLRSILNNTKDIDFQYIIKSVQIDIQIKALKPFFLWIAKNYNEFWKLELNGKYHDPIIMNGANLGYIINIEDKGSINPLNLRIVFFPEYFFNYGSFISLLFIIGSIIGFVILYHEKILKLFQKIFQMNKNERA